MRTKALCCLSIALAIVVRTALCGEEEANPKTQDFLLRGRAELDKQEFDRAVGCFSEGLQQVRGAGPVAGEFNFYLGLARQMQAETTAATAPQAAAADRLEPARRALRAPPRAASPDAGTAASAESAASSLRVR